MSVNTPLTQLADEDVTRAADAVTTLTSDLGALDTDLTQLRKDAAAATEALAVLLADEATIRAELATAPLPADADDLVTQLEDNLVQRQRAIADAARTGDAVATAERRRVELTGALGAVRVRLATATATAAASHAEADQVAGWQAAAAATPVTDAVAGASAAKTHTPYTTARARLATILDDGHATTLLPLFSRRAAEADAREKDVADRLDRARTARWTRLTYAGDPTGAVLTARNAYDQAVADLRFAAEQAAPRYAWALARLTAIVNGPSPSTVEQGRMDSLHDEAEPAVALEKTLFDAADTLRTKQSDLDAAVLAKIPGDPTVTPADPAFAAQRTAVGNAEQAVANAGTALAGTQDALDQWEAALPDSVKEQVVDFLTATATLEAVAGVDVAKRVAAVSTAEGKLVTALTSAATAAAAADRLAGEATARAGDADAYRAVAAIRRATLIRGEG